MIIGTATENNKPVELFKLHLGDLLEEFKPKLPVDYKKAITDYLREIGKKKYSTNLQFTTEPEAAAIYCMKNLEGQNLAQPGTNFMIVDCGGRDNIYGQMQYLIQQFCKDGKIPFTGDDPDFLYELDIRETSSDLRTTICLLMMISGKLWIMMNG
ncbi:unnamed protein product [Rhizophagus irregularis]|nr:unnamed protein product [Rhizophagus irregularis]